MRARSLRGELLAWLVLPLAAVVSLNIWTTYNDALETAELITERTLLSSARVIAESLRQEEGVLEAPIPPAALEMFTSDPPDRVVFRVTAPSGELLAGYADVLVPPATPRDLQPLYFDTQYRSERMRAVVIAQPVVGSDNRGSASVAVGQTLHSHDRLVAELWRKALLDQVLLVAAAGTPGPAWAASRPGPGHATARCGPPTRSSLARALRHGERPDRVEAARGGPERGSRARQPADRHPASFRRQCRASAPQSAGAGENAGERRPARDEPGSEGRGACRHRPRRGQNDLPVQPAARSGTRGARQHACCARRWSTSKRSLGTRIESTAEMALARSIDLGFETSEGPLPLHGHSSLLRELVVNLIDNAIRYTPTGGTITVGLRSEDRKIVFRVEDSGPGIPEPERQRVFERFYRRLETGGEGSGLGLAIVREIVLAHDGSIELAERVPGPGLVVTVRLPAGGIAPGAVETGSAIASPGAPAGAISPDGSRPASSDIRRQAPPP